MMKDTIVCVRIQYGVPSFQPCSPEEGILDEGKAYHHCVISSLLNMIVLQDVLDIVQNTTTPENSHRLD
jgi:hypothetical protein